MNNTLNTLKHTSLEQLIEEQIDREIALLGFSNLNPYNYNPTEDF
jgi:hypothetical protein